jgi:hypothetical protein
MKTVPPIFKTLLYPAACALAVFLLPAGARAQVTSGTYNENGDPNLANNASLNGTPFTLWTCSTPGVPGADAGSWGDSTNNAWGLWSNNSQITASASFAGGTLAVGQTVSLGFSLEWVNQQVGFDITGAGGNLLSVWFPTGASDFSYWDAGGNALTTQGWVYGTFIPFTLTYDGGSAYNATFGSASWSGTFGNDVSGAAPNGLDFYNNAQSSTNHDVELNNLVVTPAVVPEPGQVALFAIVAGAFLTVHLGRRRAALPR